MASVSKHAVFVRRHFSGNNNIADASDYYRARCAMKGECCNQRLRLRNSHQIVTVIVKEILYRYVGTIMQGFHCITLCSHNLLYIKKRHMYIHYTAVSAKFSYDWILSPFPGYDSDHTFYII